MVRVVCNRGALDAPTFHEVHGDHLGPLRGYLRERYRIARTFMDGDEAWEINSDSLPVVPVSRRVPIQ
jgi:hypothetical protein